ncbi:unnamed protein product [Owenia fusiformis]|uniref:Uncharacterized protein n=1 Tax=Owenia fusiformis TaxID=6347 RepID=A0A8S4P9M6_OWEFU|nr:unnamed protein product [Owenia fusiformis]
MQGSTPQQNEFNKKIDMKKEKHSKDTIRKAERLRLEMADSKAKVTPSLDTMLGDKHEELEQRKQAEREAIEKKYRFGFKRQINDNKMSNPNRAKSVTDKPSVLPAEKIETISE